MGLIKWGVKIFQYFFERNRRVVKPLLHIHPPQDSHCSVLPRVPLLHLPPLLPLPLWQANPPLPPMKLSTKPKPDSHRSVLIASKSKPRCVVNLGRHPWGPTPSWLSWLSNWRLTTPKKVSSVSLIGRLAFVRTSPIFTTALKTTSKRLGIPPVRRFPNCSL